MVLVNCLFVQTRTGLADAWPLRQPSTRTLCANEIPSCPYHRSIVPQDICESSFAVGGFPPVTGSAALPWVPESAGVAAEYLLAQVVAVEVVVESPSVGEVVEFPLVGEVEARLAAVMGLAWG